jgi:hypothetical protein
MLGTIASNHGKVIKGIYDRGRIRAMLYGMRIIKYDPTISEDAGKVLRKPRKPYQRIGTLLVMAKRRARAKKFGNVCRVLTFPNQA